MNTYILSIITTLILSCWTIALQAQQSTFFTELNAKKTIQKGNHFYQQQDYETAKKHYQEAAKNHTKQKINAEYNLANAEYKTEKYQSAREKLDAIASQTKDKQQLHQIYHNIGNTYMQEKKWKDAAEAYKIALRHQPTDQETKYNLAYANVMIKNSQDNNDQNDQQEDNEQNQQNDNNKQDEQKNDKQDEDSKGNKQEQQQEQNRQSQPAKLSEKQAENILNALRQEEKKLQEKQDKEKGVPVRLEKDW